jgi:hypothetical protein
VTPDQVRSQISAYLVEQARGPQAHFDAELKAERAEDAYQAAFDRAYLSSDGSIEDRKAVARLATLELRDAMEIARAEFGRVKLKIRQLDSSLMATQSLLKSMMAELS